MIVFLVKLLVDSGINRSCFGLILLGLDALSSLYVLGWGVGWKVGV